MELHAVTPESVGFSSTRLNRINAVMQGFVDRERPPGLITLVSRRGEVAYLNCFGLRDVEAGKPMQPDTILRIYSMTKPITAVALMILFEQGCFLLQDPVSKYIPSFQQLKVRTGSDEAGLELADLDRPITVQDLLTQTSGLAYGLRPNTPMNKLYCEAEIFDWRDGLIRLQVPLPELVRRLAKLPLADQPGTAWRYSLAYDVMGHLVSVLADLPFDVFLQERVFAPLGMDDTGFYVPEEELDRFSGLYNVTGAGDLVLKDPATAASPFASVAFHPSGGAGLVSTVLDYLHFAQMLANGGELDGARVLGRKTVARMAMNHLLADLLPMKLYGMPMPGVGYGLGFRVVIDETQRSTLVSAGAYGWGGAGGSRFWIDPQEELVSISMTQIFGSAPVDPVFSNLVYQAIAD
jgi:CubicO group peptidase (beta-lactamase class C family)